MLGYGFPLGEDTPVAQKLVTNRASRRERVEKMIAQLNAIGIPITVADVLTESGGGHALGRPHVAKALIRGGYVADVSTAFDQYLSPGRPGYQPTPYVTPLEAVDVIARSGGVPVLAHPGRLKDETILDELVDAGLVGLEVFYATHTPAQTAHFRNRAAHYGLVMTAGAASTTRAIACTVSGWKWMRATSNRFSKWCCMTDEEIAPSSENPYASRWPTAACSRERCTGTATGATMATPTMRSCPIRSPKASSRGRDDPRRRPHRDDRRCERRSRGGRISSETRNVRARPTRGAPASHRRVRAVRAGRRSWPRRAGSRG